MLLALLFNYLLLNMFRMLVHPSSGACDLLWFYFMCYIALVRCVLVLRCGSAGLCSILMQAEVLLLCSCGMWGLTRNPHIAHEQTNSASACIRIPHHPSRTTP